MRIKPPSNTPWVVRPPPTPYVAGRPITVKGVGVLVFFFFFFEKKKKLKKIKKRVVFSRKFSLFPLENNYSSYFLEK
jgi:hypothetical protein